MPGQHDVDQHDVRLLSGRTPRPLPRRSRPPRPSSPRPRGPASPPRGCARRPRRPGCVFPRAHDARIPCQGARPVPPWRRRASSDLEQVVEDAGCGGEQPGPASTGASGEVAHAAAGLAGDQLAGGDVPRVEAASRSRRRSDRRRRSRGRARPSPRRRMSRTSPIRCSTTRSLRAPALRAVGEPGGDERQAEVGRGRCRRSARPSSVAPPPRGGGEQLADRRHVDGADEHAVGVAGGDRRRPQRGGRRRSWSCRRSGR